MLWIINATGNNGLLNYKQYIWYVEGGDIEL